MPRKTQKRLESLFRARRRGAAGEKSSSPRLDPVPREAPESVAFRRALEAEHLEAMIHQIGPGVDAEALGELADFVMPIVDGERTLPLIVPWRPVDDHAEFDRAVCATSLKEYFRRTMESDRPGAEGCVPLDPTTLEPDPTRPVPDVQLGPYLRVVELAPGVRLRKSVGIAFLGPGDLAVTPR